MKNILFLLLVLIAMPARAVTNLAATVSIPSLGISSASAYIVIGTPMRVSDYTNRPVPLDTDLLLLADPVNKTNANITFPQIKAYTTTLSSTNPWVGPTNYITLGTTNHYFYVANTPCAVTGFVYSASVANPSVLTISNAASTNITFTILASAVQEDSSTTYTITNGYVLKSWMEYADGMTNQVTRVFKH